MSGGRDGERGDERSPAGEDALRCGACAPRLEDFAVGQCTCCANKSDKTGKERSVGSAEDKFALANKTGEVERDDGGRPPHVGHRRIGEAKNPGPPASEAMTSTLPTAAAVDVTTSATTGMGVRQCEADRLPWGEVRPMDGLAYPRPHRPGFRDVWTPGFGSGAGPSDVDDEGTEVFRLIIETVNATSWGPLRKRLRSTTAHVVFAQETKVAEGKRAEVSTWAIGNGWKMIAAPAIVGRRGGVSAGVAIFARKELGIRFPSHGAHVLEPGRAVAAIVEAPACRPFLAISLYLRTGVGLAESNLGTLEKVRKCVKSHADLQSVVGGDFNNVPEAIANVGCSEEMGTRVIAPVTGRGTCRTVHGSRVYDYFMATKALTDCIAEVATVEGTNIRTHTPVQITFHPRQTSLKKLTLRAPEPLARERVYGPLPPPPSWRRAKTAAMEAVWKARVASRDEAQSALDGAYQTFVDTAELELADATGTDIQWPAQRGGGPKFVWRSVLPEQQPDIKEPTTAALTWLEGVVREAGRIGLGNCPPAQRANGPVS